ncbi:hypothetical protein [Pseudoflavonifractor sp. MCC625]|uniref:hypothetical protein n=1 Tax=Pseudoflavonifractor sp. MCC625 TaxID=2592647 RepID=UPI001C033B05|nr:hypothetical protein [Pseudoflavonifractor sp. MCC625]MBT9685698.1 hypothetical protein [Pseudoflavonifractor sp. MCC625]
MEEATVVRLEAWHLLDEERGAPYLCRALSLPEGDDVLSCLSDTLSDGETSLGLVLIGADLMRESSWGKQLLGVLTQAANTNRKLHLVFRD